MPNIRVEQAWDAIDYEKDEQDFRNSTATLYYIAFDAEDEADAVEAVKTVSALTFESIPRKSTTVAERLTETDWKIAVKYAYRQNDDGDDEEEPQFNFDISNSTKHIVTSLRQVAKIPATAPDSQGINDGEGVDIVCPVCTISETHFFSPSVITANWKKSVAKMVGSINGSSFWSYDAGELLFTGCSGTRNGRRSTDKWQVTFRFGVQANQSGIQIGTLGTIDKRGWDLLWVRFKERPITVGSGSNERKIIVNAPIAAYTEKVYPEANFSSLGI